MEKPVRQRDANAEAGKTAPWQEKFVTWPVRSVGRSEHALDEQEKIDAALAAADLRLDRFLDPDRIWIVAVAR